MAACAVFEWWSGSGAGEHMKHISKKKHLKILGYLPTRSRLPYLCYCYDAALTSYIYIPSLPTSTPSPLRSFFFGFRGPGPVHY